MQSVTTELLGTQALGDGVDEESAEMASLASAARAYCSDSDVVMTMRTSVPFREMTARETVTPFDVVT